MEKETLIIRKEQVRSLIDRLRDANGLEPCIEEVKKMLKVKSTLLWHADAACGCVGPGPAGDLCIEVQMIENILVALKQSDVAKGASLLNEYAQMIP